MLKISTPFTQVDSAAQFTTGSKTVDRNGVEYIYLKGVASVAQYEWVIYTNSSGSVTRLTTATLGNVGIAQGAITEGKFGWFAIKGRTTGLLGTGPGTAGLRLSASGTAAYVSGGTVANTGILGAFLATTSTGTISTVELNYPVYTGAIS